ncbi:dual specificity protein phosphatase [Polychytrium aggregatum]|uniref:dual specificity protein phosphatase n=1 Tax=Polychytrium aggregatum TaxID=110093 RepID=UPI0022FEBDF4|nr:dual specificity protein phosphatase [Polychytrium aggregatum]KAI9206103.1 dual specificity protein phosphatase [Polychytrium aggregatum]
MPYTATGLFNHATAATPVDIFQNAREFIKDKLYFTSVSYPPPQYVNVHFFTIDSTLVYISFYSDFGPSNMGHILRFCEILNEKLVSPINANKKICLLSSMENDKRANAAFLMCAYQMIAFKKTPEEAFQPLIGISPPFTPYRDAGYGPATYYITILDCLRGLYKGLTTGLLNLDTFDCDEYKFYERVENGDLNWITDKFVAFASPHDEPASAGFPPNLTGNGFFGMSATVAWEKNETKEGRTPGQPFYSAYKIDDLVRYFQEKQVRTVVRLNNKIYDRQKFVDSGIEHIELYFPDGTTPPDGILKRFLDLCENRQGKIGIHCKAGLGRTGTLIAAYLMKHYKFTAAEVISYLRILRPGSVVGPQQNYLQSMQSKLWKMHPSSKLHPLISLLKPATFFTTTRFSPPNQIVALLRVVDASAEPEDEVDEDSNVAGIDTMELSDAPEHHGQKPQFIQNDSSLHRAAKPGEVMSIPVQPRKHISTTPSAGESRPGRATSAHPSLVRSSGDTACPIVADLQCP